MSQTHGSRCRAVLSALLLGVAAGQAGAQSSSPLQVPAGARLGLRRPLLLRADAPIPQGLPDPSLAAAFGSVRDGITLDGVGFLRTPTPDDPTLAFFCTTQRIGPRTVITAAHCVTDDDTGALLPTTTQASAFFVGPGGVETQIGAYNVRVRPDWLGFNNPDTFLAGDVAVVNFAEVLPSYVTTYDIFPTVLPPGIGLTGVGSTHVGLGTFGTGTGPTGFDLKRRWGQNAVDFTAPELFAGLDEMLFTDFQDASGGWGTNCLVVGVCNPSRGATEAGVAGGDSGGPLFIGGQLAAVASLGTYWCDPAFEAECVPLVVDPERPFDSFGALNGFAPLARNLGFINAATVPEPSTAALAGVGVVTLLGAGWRRRRATR